MQRMRSHRTSGRESPGNQGKIERGTRFAIRNGGGNVMVQAPSNFVVLAALDDDALADATSKAAAAYATAATGAELHFIHVVGWVPAHPGPTERASGIDPSSLLEGARASLERIARGFDREIVCHIALGDPAREVLQMAAHIDADLIFTGSHGRKGLARLLLGSVAERIVRSASCPVLVVRDKDYHRTLAPEIEPPCPDCLAAQRESRGTRSWCARHSEHHPAAHLHYEFPETFAVGSMLVRP
jgi:nucleotide-binding universal stress UspA family protein